MVKNSKDYLSKLQEFLNNQIPDVILQLLRKTGFDSAIAIQTFDLDLIKSVETYINSSDSIIEFLENTDYKNEKPFAFMPGHKALLIGLQKKSLEFEEYLKLSSNQVPKCVNKKLINQANASEARNEDIDEEDPATFTKEHINLLHTKVVKFVKKKNIENIILDIGPVSESLNKQGQRVFKCMLKCLICAIRIPCSMTTFWQISNYENHLKRHLTLDLTVKNERQAVAVDPKESDKTLDQTLEISSKNDSTKNKSSDKLIQRVSINSSVQAKINDVFQLNHLCLGNNAEEDTE